jgi:hypothetical protein
MKQKTKKLSLVVDSELEELIEFVSFRNNRDRSLMIRTMIYDYIFTNHPDLMGVK